MGVQFGILNPREIDDLPFSTWAHWYQHEQAEPWLDRRVDAQAFLICRVLSEVIHTQAQPVQEMFQLSASLDRATDPDSEEDDPDSPDLTTFAVNMGAAGFSTYIPG